MRKHLFSQVTLVGVGLIGGSIGMALKRRRLAASVTGVVRKRSTIAKAFAKGALDAATLDLKKGVKDADLVVLCAPVFTIVRQLGAIAPHLKRGAVVVDVGSSKGEILRAARKLPKHVRFVGCHPMAGSEKCGTEHADANLFRGAVCFLTSQDAKVASFWRSLGAKPVFIDAERHDAWVAKASHLPHVSAFALFSFLSRVEGAVNPSLKPAARLAKSNPALWAEILLSNRRALIPAISEFSLSVSRVVAALSRGDAAALKRILSRANSNARRIDGSHEE